MWRAVVSDAAADGGGWVAPCRAQEMGAGIGVPGTRMGTEPFRHEEAPAPPYSVATRFPGPLKKGSSGALWRQSPNSGLRPALGLRHPAMIRGTPPGTPSRHRTTNRNLSHESSKYLFPFLLITCRSTRVKPLPPSCYPGIGGREEQRRGSAECQIVPRDFMRTAGRGDGDRGCRDSVARRAVRAVIPTFGLVSLIRWSPWE